MKGIMLENRNQGFRAGAVIIKDNKILLMHQILGDKEDFYTLPGGSWEVGETLEQTCKREIMEEFNLDVNVGKLIFMIDTSTRIAFYFACDTDGHEISLGGPEKDRMNHHEQYYVEWLDLKDIHKVAFIPPHAKDAILKYMEDTHQPTFFFSENKSD